MMRFKSLNTTTLLLIMIALSLYSCDQSKNIKADNALKADLSKDSK